MSTILELSEGSCAGGLGVEDLEGSGGHGANDEKQEIWVCVNT